MFVFYLINIFEIKNEAEVVEQIHFQTTDLPLISSGGKKNCAVIL